MTRNEKFLTAASLAFFFTLLFPKLLLLNIAATAALVVCSFFSNPVSEKWALLKARRYVQVMLLFFLCLVVSLALSDHFRKGLRFLDSRLALFYLPLCIGTLRLRKNVRNQVLLGGAVLTTLVLAACLLYGVYRVHLFHRPDFLYNDALTDVLGQQSVYVALLVNVAIYIFAYHLLFQKSIYKGGMVLAVLFLLAMSYLLASRIMMGVLAATTLGFCFYYIFKRKKYLEGATLLLGLLIGGFLIFKFFPSTLNRFKELAYTKFEYQSLGKESHYNMALDSTQWNGANFRRAAWACGWQLFTQHPLLGVGLGDKRIELFRVYEQRGFQFALQTKKNVHNNYLDILYSMGAVAFLIFLAGWLVLPLLTAFKHGDGLAALVILTFAAAWVTEIYFDRNVGGLLTGFLIPFLLTDKK